MQLTSCLSILFILQLKYKNLRSSIIYFYNNNNGLLLFIIHAVSNIVVKADSYLDHNYAACHHN